jgi:hypothetical protein
LLEVLQNSLLWTVVSIDRPYIYRPTKTRKTEVKTRKTKAGRAWFQAVESPRRAGRRIPTFMDGPRLVKQKSRPLKQKRAGLDGECFEMNETVKTHKTKACRPWHTLRSVEHIRISHWRRGNVQHRPTVAIISSMDGKGILLRKTVGCL